MQTEFIKTQNLIPGVYCSESRDFQLFCRALDVIVNAVKYDADSIPQLNNTDEIRENMLELLQTKLGFVPSQPYSTEKLRIILSVVPLLRKYKGCRKGIEYALNAYSKMYQLRLPIVFHVVQVEPVYATEEVNSESSESDPVEIHGIKTVNIIRIGLSDKSVDRILLDDLLHYVLPFGFAIRYYEYHSLDLFTEADLSETVLVIPSYEESMFVVDPNELQDYRTE